MKISIFGLGYVGTVSAACLARLGHEVIGVDTVESKLAEIRRGRAPVLEKDLGEIVASVVGSGRLQVTSDARAAIRASDVSLICVGTPTNRGGTMDLRHIRHVSREIGEALAEKSSPHTVTIRSTVLPGTTREIVLPLLEQFSGKKAGADFAVGANPEFLREGSAIEDFHAPPKIVVGADDKATASQIVALYSGIDAPIIETSLEAAEAVKYVDNVWHALKIAFANEIGSFCKASGVSAFEVMSIFCKDTKLNLSSAYLRPGFAFGGSCLPKDVRAFSQRARSLELDLPVISAILPSNAVQISRALELIMALGRRPVGVLGLSFKAGTDDIRESPLLDLIERLIGKGFDVKIFDPNVQLSHLVGANRERLLEAIPHISSLLADQIGDVLSHGEVIVVGNADKEFSAAATLLREDKYIIDLVGIERPSERRKRYDGVNW